MPVKTDVVCLSGYGKVSVRLRYNQARQKFGDGRKLNQCVGKFGMVLAMFTIRLTLRLVPGLDM